MIFIGVDPGKSGAIAIINNSMEIDIKPMPLIKGKGARSEYDLVEIKNCIDLEKCFGALFVTVEKQQPMPPGSLGGSLANYNRGCASGWTWMLMALGISHQLVHPKTWQKAMLAGTSGTDTKQRSIIAAQRLFPGQSLKRTERCRKPDDGFSDALLICAYGMRTYGK